MYLYLIEQDICIKYLIEQDICIKYFDRTRCYYFTHIYVSVFSIYTCIRVRYLYKVFDRTRFLYKVFDRTRFMYKVF